MNGEHDPSVSIVHRFRRKGFSASVAYGVYVAVLLLLVLSGFGQMPIFKRYYIADIPGLEWLAAFFVTHYLHYLGAALFLGISSYAVCTHALSGRRRLKITAHGYLKFFFLSGIIATGVLLAVKNLPDVQFPPGWIIVLDLMHLGLVMGFLATAFFGLVLKKGWTTYR